MKQSGETGLIILAAGASVRFGSPKQLLRLAGETLLRRIVRESLESVCRPVIVVLGFEADEFKTELNNLNVHIVDNLNWKQGMGSSVRAGLEKLLTIENSVSGVVLGVCDQPFVTAETINQLVETYEKNDSLIVASAYRETLGVPALFGREIFPQLLELKTNGGAKKIINQFQFQTIGVSFEAGAIDIDTVEDFKNLNEHSRGKF